MTRRNILHTNGNNPYDQTVLEVGEHYLLSGTPAIIMDDQEGDLWWRECQSFTLKDRQVQVLNIFGVTTIPVNTHPGAYPELALPHQKILFRDSDIVNRCREYSFYELQDLGSTAIAPHLQFSVTHLR